MSTAIPVEFRPYDPAFAADPYPIYARLREKSPIFLSEELGMTLFTRYEDIRALLMDKRVGRTMDHVATPTERRQSAERWSHLPNYNRYVRVNLLEMEGADHTRLRRLVSAALDPRRIRKLRDRIQAVVNELLDRIAPHANMEFLEELAVPLPVHMISELLGWPAELRDCLRPWSAQIVRLYEKDYTKEDEARAESATTEFAAALNKLADERGRTPRDDLVSALVAIRDHGQRLSRDELIATCMLLLNAGHEATVNGAGNGLLALIRRPDQMARLRSEPALIGTAIEELLRFDSPLQLFHRFVLEDFEHGDVKFARGDMVGLLYGSANRDPQGFERPDELDLARKPNSHLAFGAGTHFCLGAPLARLELDVLFTTLLRRLPTVRLYGRQPEFRPGLVFRGLRELRVCW